MILIKKIYMVILSNIFLVIRNIFGCNINFSFINLVSPLSIIHTSANSKIYIGKKTYIRSNTEINAVDGTIIIDGNCFINRNCMIVALKKIKIENGVSIGPNCCIYDHDHDGKGGYISKEITIQKNCWIGAGSIILKGVRIGENVTVAAGSLVTKSIPSNTIYYNKRNVDIIKKG